jgi:hypothetical protein
MMAQVNETPASTSPGGLKSQIYIAPQISVLSSSSLINTNYSCMKRWPVDNTFAPLSETAPIVTQKKTYFLCSYEPNRIIAQCGTKAAAFPYESKIDASANNAPVN